jgi:DNA uptake protein ComE-like DNA-binding protein
VTPKKQQRRCRAALWVGGAGLAAMFLVNQPAQTAELLAREVDEEAVKAVCGRCHDTQLVMERVRPKTEWIDIFNRMVELGATGTDEQFDAVGRYILTRLTQVRVNEASAKELALVLDIPGTVAAAIVARRERQKFRDMTDLAAVPGLDPASIFKEQARIVF